jgi:hypothetical protein
MRHYLHSLCIVLITVVATEIAFGQDCRVTTTVRFLDKHQQPVFGIGADELKAEVDGSGANIVSLSSAAKPEIILLIDASSSVKGTWTKSIAAAKQFAANGDGIAAVVFADSILASANNRTDTEKLLDQLAATTPSRRGTALYETLVAVGSRVKGRNAALVMIGDGGDNMSRFSSDEVVSMFLRSSWPPVFGLILDYDQPPSRFGYFKKIASATGGITISPLSASKVAEGQATLLAEVLAPITVTLQVSRPISRPVKLKLDVVGQKHGIHVVHPIEVAACDAASKPLANPQ